MTRRRSRGGLLRRWIRRLVGAVLGLVAGYLVSCAACLVLLVQFDPPTTAVQLQRRIECWFAPEPYAKRYRALPLAEISSDLEHAVIVAEDARFFAHDGVDWKAIREAQRDNLRRGRSWRGGSTITQQLVKNLFLTTRGGFARKAFELPLAYLTELVLSKERILELYLNVIEWGPGVYGAEAAAQRWYGVPAARLGREQAAELAACIPSPRHCSPARMERRRGVILERMQQMNW